MHPRLKVLAVRPAGGDFAVPAVGAGAIELVKDCVPGAPAQQQLLQILPFDLCAGIAGQTGEGIVDHDDPAIGIKNDDALGNTLEGQAGLFEGGFGFLALSHIANGADGALEHPFGRGVEACEEIDPDRAFAAVRGVDQTDRGLDPLAALKGIEDGLPVGRCESGQQRVRTFRQSVRQGAKDALQAAEAMEFGLARIPFPHPQVGRLHGDAQSLFTLTHAAFGPAAGHGHAQGGLQRAGFHRFDQIAVGRALLRPRQGARFGVCGQEDDRGVHLGLNGLGRLGAIDLPFQIDVHEDQIRLVHPGQFHRPLARGRSGHHLMTEALEGVLQVEGHDALVLDHQNACLSHVSMSAMSRLTRISKWVPWSRASCQTPLA